MTNAIHAHELEQDRRFSIDQYWANFLRTLGEIDLRTMSLDVVAIRESC
jgi:hypothetical protein